MEVAKGFIQIINVLSALAVIVLVLLQHGKGADMGAAFGSGSAGSLFGSSGSANFLSRTTAVCATIFFASLLALVYVDAGLSKKSADLGVMSSVPQNQKTVPLQVPIKKDSQPVVPN